MVSPVACTLSSCNSTIATTLLSPYSLDLLSLCSQWLAKQREKNLETYLNSSKAIHVESSYEVEVPIYWLVMTLLFRCSEKRNANKLRPLERLTILTRVDLSQSPANIHIMLPPLPTWLSSYRAAKCHLLTPQLSLTKQVKEYSVYKPILVLFGIISALYNTMFKVIACVMSRDLDLQHYSANPCLT